MSHKPTSRTSRFTTELLADTLKNLNEQESQPNPEADASPTRSVLTSREADIRRSKRRDIERVSRLRVDPTRCRMWSHHNRNYALLNEVRCADLIEGFRAMGQQFPAIVREVSEDPDHDWEVVCGARRHWTAQYLGQPLLIEPRDLTDEEAFRLSDIENRDRQDISDYERALDYRHALALYYDNSQSQMAQRLECSAVWLSRFLAIANLPDEIVKAYRAVTEIKVSHARLLNPLLESPASRKRVLAAAVALGEDPQEGRVVVKRLQQAARQQEQRPSDGKRYYAKSSNKPMLAVSVKPKGDLRVEVFKDSGASKAELVKAFEQSLEEHF